MNKFELSTYVKIKLYITSKESNLLLISNFAMYDLSFIEARLGKCHNIDSKSFFYYCSASSDKKHESYLNFLAQRFIASQNAYRHTCKCHIGRQQQ